MSDAIDFNKRVRKARKKFIAMAATYSLGVFNDNFFKTAAMLIAVEMHRNSLQGIATTLFTAPFILFAAYAGWFADRFPKKDVIVGAKILELLAMTAGAAGLYLMSWPLIFLMLFIMATQSAIFSPALNGSIPELYPDRYVPTANARIRAIVNIMIILGIATSGILLDKENGRYLVAGGVIIIALLGVVISIGAPRFPAANPGMKFPYPGPVNTVIKLWGLRKDKLLASTIIANTFIWFIAVLLSQVINDLGLNQIGTTKTRTSLLLIALLLGIAVGGLLSAKLSRICKWFKILVPATFCLSICMGLLYCIPLIPRFVVVPSLHLLFPPAFLWLAACSMIFFFLGIAGGVYMIPTESFIQVRPGAAVKGSVWAAANFASFTGMSIAGGVYFLLASFKIRPTDCFGLMAIMTFLWAFWIQASFFKGKPLTSIASQIAQLILGLRYRITIRDMDGILEKDSSGILILPNHPALIDPPILVTALYPELAIRPLADENQINRPVIRWFTKRIRVLPIPDISKVGQKGNETIQRAIKEIAETLKRGDNVILYPAGSVLRNRYEEIGGNSAVESILMQAPEARIVLVQTKGLWGSSFSWSSGKEPKVLPILLKGAWRLLLNGIFFGPKRDVEIKLKEPGDFPRHKGRKAINKYLENFYNQVSTPNTFVPYTVWERGGIRTLPEPERPEIKGDMSEVSESVRRQVIEHLREITGKTIIEGHNSLSYDLGLDSLARAELILWIGSEFGGMQSDPEAFRTVNDVLLAASGFTITTGSAELKPVPKAWFKTGKPGKRGEYKTGKKDTVIEGKTITGIFLKQAKANPGRIIMADQTSGAKTYRDIVRAIFALKRVIKKIPGEYVGIMLPASVAATTTYLATLFAGKIPVMINWTVGTRVIRRALDLFKINSVITSRLLVSRLEKSGTQFPGLKDSFLYLEDVGRSLTLFQKLSAAAKAYLSLGSLGIRAEDEDKTAVILFTSGSESLPKAVPLTHKNFISNLKDIVQYITIKEGDRILGILPPFHSMGLISNVILPCIANLPAVYHPNPTEGVMIARIIDAYKPTIIAGTPTFLNGIVKSSETEQLKSLRIAVTGAEKCPDNVYKSLSDRCPGLLILEGYGITECSPIVSINTETNPKAGTIGHVLPSVEYAIVDTEAKERVKPGERGMLLVRGASIFKGYKYYNGPSPFVTFETKKWYKTGDLVFEDENGVLSFSGRLKRFVKIGGEMISLPAIENVLVNHFAGEEEDGPIIAIESTGEETHPELVLVTTKEINREEANNVLREEGFSALHNIRRIIKMEEIPVLGTGKTNYRKIKKQLETGEKSDEPA